MRCLVEYGIKRVPSCLRALTPDGERKRKSCKGASTMKSGSAHGTWKNGQVILDKPADWPEGCRVTIEPAAKEEPLDMREEDWQDTPEAIADWLQWYDSLEPLEMTPQEEAEWQAARTAMKEYTVANMHKDTEGMFP
jgi:hypothetical protein